MVIAFSWKDNIMVEKGGALIQDFIRSWKFIFKPNSNGIIYPSNILSGIFKERY